MSGIAGRTDYDAWNQKTSQLVTMLESEEERESSEAKEALGLNGKYASSEAEAKEREKQKQVRKAKGVLEKYKKREMKNIHVLRDLFPKEDYEEKEEEEEAGQLLHGVVEHKQKDSSKAKKTSTHPVRYITRDLLDAGKRVLCITDTEGPGHLLLTQDISHLESKMPVNTTLTPKSYPADVENVVPSIPKDKNGDSRLENKGTCPEDDASQLPSRMFETTSLVDKNDRQEQEQYEEEKYRTIHGLIKLHLTNLHNITVSVRCKVITGFVEVSHCSNVILKFEKEATVATIQADLCQHLTIEFHDAPSGKNVVHGDRIFTTVFWGEDKDDRVFHAGVSNLHVKIFRDGFLDLETHADYKSDGAEPIGNATAEEVQFVTSVVEGALLTERVLRAGSATGTTVTGGIGAGRSDSGGSARAMTAREMKEVEMKRSNVLQRIESNIKVVNKEGNEVPATSCAHGPNTDSEVAPDEKIEEVYAGISKATIDAIIQDCDAHKAKGNESFNSGEYAQAILLYTLSLDRASELPDHDAVESRKNDASPSAPLRQLFPRHIILANRSACFLKLGYHEKALADGVTARNLDPTYVKGVFRQGLALHAIGRYEEAIKVLAAAIKIEPNNKQIKQALQFAEIRHQQELRKRMDGK